MSHPILPVRSYSRAGSRHAWDGHLRQIAQKIFMTQPVVHTVGSWQAQAVRAQHGRWAHLALRQAKQVMRRWRVLIFVHKYSLKCAQGPSVLSAWSVMLKTSKPRLPSIARVTLITYSPPSIYHERHDRNEP